MECRVTLIIILRVSVGFRIRVRFRVWIMRRLGIEFGVMYGFGLGVLLEV